VILYGRVDDVHSVDEVDERNMSEPCVKSARASTVQCQTAHTQIPDTTRGVDNVATHAQ